MRHYKDVKEELCSEMVEKRRREEEVVNWSYILKYLLSSSSKLRKQLQAERNLRESLERKLTDPTEATRSPDKGAFRRGNSQSSMEIDGKGSQLDDRSSMSPLQRVRARMEIMKAEEEERQKNRGISGVIRRLAGRSPKEKGESRGRPKQRRGGQRERRLTFGIDKGGSFEQ